MKTVPFQEVLNQAAEFAGRSRDKIPVVEQTMLQNYLATEFETLFTTQPWAFLIPDFVNVKDITNQQTSLNEGGRLIDETLVVMTGYEGATGVTGTYTLSGEIYTNPAGYTIQKAGGLYLLVSPPANGSYLYAQSPTLISDNWLLINPIVGVAPLASAYGTVVVPEFGDILAVLTLNPHLSDYWRHVTCSLGDNVLWLDDPVSEIWVEAMLPYPGPEFPDLTTLSLTEFYAARCPRVWKQILAHKGAAQLFNADGNPTGMGVQMGLADTALAKAVNRFCPTPDWRAFRMSPPRQKRLGMAAANAG